MFNLSRKSRIFALVAPIALVASTGLIALPPPMPPSR